MHDESLGLKIIAASGILRKSIDVKTKECLGRENDLNNLSIINYS